MFIAIFYSTHFEFEGVGNDSEEAVSMLLRGLDYHGEQYDIGKKWYLDRGNSTRDSIENFVYENVNIRFLQTGRAYRNGEQI